MGCVMRMRRVAPILLVTALLTGGVTGGWGLLGNDPAASALAVADQKVLAGRADAAKPISAPEQRARAAHLEAVKREKREPGCLAEDERATLVEVAELQMLAQGTGLELGAAQWTALAQVTLQMQAVRQAYEADIATTTVVARGRYRVDIPSYPSAGAALRTKFYATLGTQLGDAATAEVMDRLGARLEARFGGFGISVQSLEINGDARGGVAGWEVTRTVTFSDQAEGKEKVTTRRETYFPTWEDPAGERWGALLALVAARAG